MVEVVGPENRGGDRLAWLLEAKMTMDQAMEESEKKMNSHVPDMAEKTVLDAVRMCAVEGQQGVARSVTLFAIRSISGDVLEECITAREVQKGAMTAVVHPMMIRAVIANLLKGDQLMDPIAKFVPICADKELEHAKREEDHYEPKKEVREIPLSTRCQILWTTT